VLWSDLAFPFRPALNLPEVPTQRYIPNYRTISTGNIGGHASLVVG